MYLIQQNRFRIVIILILIYSSMNLYFIRHKFIYRNKNQVQCNTSMIESDQFICESDHIWQKRREFYFKQHETNIFTMNEYEDYFKKNWQPEFKCQSEIRLGEEDGGKWACDIEYLLWKPSCLVYSLGSGRDFRFEQAIHERLPHCSIHTIDMQYSVCPNDICKFHLVNLGNGQNGTKTLRQFMTEINHTNSVIDILKVDIEYSEYLFFHTLFSNNDLNRNSKPVYIRQILIEVHLDRQRFFESNALFYLFNSQNYVIYHKELNPSYPAFACEFGLLRLNRKFFRGHF